MSKNKAFSSLSALVIGAVAGATVAASPLVAVAEHHDGHDKEATEHKCSGDKKCSGEKKCSGDKHEGHDH